VERLLQRCQLHSSGEKEEELKIMGPKKFTQNISNKNTVIFMIPNVGNRVVMLCLAFEQQQGLRWCEGCTAAFVAKMRT
jgi:hypothetical protein